jgi:hypothetical protein
MDRRIAGYANKISVRTTMVQAITCTSNRQRCLGCISGWSAPQSGQGMTSQSLLSISCSACRALPLATKRALSAPMPQIVCIVPRPSRTSRYAQSLPHCAQRTNFGTAATADAE